MKILIAEDDPITLKMLDGLLTSWGYEVVTATNGAETCRILQETDAPKLALLDWGMLGLEGVDICKRLRQKQTPTPTYLMLLTGRSTKTDMAAGLAAGANDCITKPFDLDELRARVRVGRTMIMLQANVAERMREFEDYVEDAPLGILVVEQDGSIGYTNNRLESIFGYQPGELLGQPVEILVPTGLRERHIELRNGYFQNPQKRVMASRTGLVGQRKDNSVVHVAIGLNPTRRGTAVRMVCTVMDLTELRKAEEQLERFFDLSLDLFAIAHVNGRLLRVNSNYARLVGRSSEQLLSRPFFDFVHPEDVPSVRDQVQRLAEGELVIEFRCRLRDSSGNDHWVEWNARSVAEDGTIYAVGRICQRPES